MDDHAVQPAVVHETRQAAGQFLCRERDAGAAVFQVVRQFIRRAHRVHRHHHRLGAQDGVVGDDELRAILAEQQHAVARFHAGAMLQIAGHRVDLALEPRIVQHRVVEHDGGFVGIPRGRGLQVEDQAGLGLADPVRQPLGPVLMMRLLHSCLPPQAVMPRAMISFMISFDPP
ncbi:hypothetical protein D3C71_1594210 [compost metagenome]